MASTWYVDVTLLARAIFVKGTTHRQQQILDFVAAYIANHTVAPTCREIAAHFGFSSLGTVYSHLKHLKKKGLLETVQRGPRSLRLPGVTNEPLSIPLIGCIQGSLPLELFREHETVSVPPALIPHEGEHYLLEIRGGAHIEEGILPGDLLLVTPRERPQAGETIIALIDNHTTLIKRLFFEDSFVRLESIHPLVTPLIFRREDLTCQGSVVGLLRRY